MATDGMYETLFPFLLKGTDNPLYVTLAHYLMSEESLNFTELKEDGVQQKMKQFVNNIPGNQVNDDKTILVMVDSDVHPNKLEDAYYKSPDWAELKQKYDEEYRRLAYPHLYNQQVQEETKEIKDIDEKHETSIKERMNRLREKLLAEVNKAFDEDDKLD